jgi:hypothetical protein
LTRLLRDRGIPATQDTRQRIAHFLTRPQLGKKAIASITATLTKNAAQTKEAIDEFFGMVLPDNLGVARSEICSIRAAKSCGISAWHAVTGARYDVSLPVDQHHARLAIKRAIAWSGLRPKRRDLQSVQLDLPELGLVLRANAGTYWLIEAYIDRAANYQWIPMQLTEERSARASTTRLPTNNQ